MSDWLLPGAERDVQSVAADWLPAVDDLIDGVIVHESKNMMRGSGMLTELWRDDWELDDLGIAQVFTNTLEPGSVSAWHAHEFATDRLAVHTGALTIALHDSRQTSPTFGRVNEFHMSDARPTLLLVPPQIWHGVSNRSSRVGALTNMVDHAYTYEAPDHWRLPQDCADIPYTF